MEEQHDWLDTVLWTDEAHSTLSSIVNTRNCRVWTTEKSHSIIEVPLQNLKGTVSHYFNHALPPRSSDLTPCDFWLWEIQKSKVYRDQPALAALKDAIRQNVSAITQEILLNTVNGVGIRLTAVLLNNGQLIEHLLQY
ncbi:hypothetical protein TNCV_2885921 [Trichonephila clavipes]|nr:hypothetical protein TNCV_2885921 [Trichonephila clavipes]